VSKTIKHTETRRRIVLAKGWKKAEMESSYLMNIKLSYAG
jgi:hypothetical protein